MKKPPRSVVRILDVEAEGGAAVIGAGLALAIYFLAPPDVKAAIVNGIRQAHPRKPAAPSPPAVDLGKKYPGAIDV